jgi:hypothetical protein
MFSCLRRARMRRRRLPQQLQRVWQRRQVPEQHVQLVGAHDRVERVVVGLLLAVLALRLRGRLGRAARRRRMRPHGARMRPRRRGVRGLREVRGHLVRQLGVEGVVRLHVGKGRGGRRQCSGAGRKHRRGAGRRSCCCRCTSSYGRRGV